MIWVSINITIYITQRLKLTISDIKVSISKISQHLYFNECQFSHYLAPNRERQRLIEPMAHWWNPLLLQKYECYELGIVWDILNQIPNGPVGDAFPSTQEWPSCQRGYGGATATDSHWLTCVRGGMHHLFSPYQCKLITKQRSFRLPL